MRKANKTKKVLIITLTWMLISGCLIGQRSDIEFPNLKSQEFSGEIARVEAMLPKTADRSSKAQAHLRLCLLHLSQDNPNPDYSAALKELDLYASLDQEAGRKVEIQSLLAALRALKKSVDENKHLKTKMEQLVQENQEVKKALEQLKSLDIDMEKRRKEIK